MTTITPHRQTKPLNVTEEKLLAEIASWPAGYSTSSSAATRTRLEHKGLVVAQGNRVTLTPAGHEALAIIRDTTRKHFELSPAVVAEYNDREVFNGGDTPWVPTEPGRYKLPIATLKEMRDDAEHWGNVNGDGVEDVVPGTRRMYRALYAKLKTMLDC